MKPFPFACVAITASIAVGTATMADGDQPHTHIDSRTLPSGSGAMLNPGSTISVASAGGIGGFLTLPMLALDPEAVLLVSHRAAEWLLPNRGAIQLSQTHRDSDQDEG